MAKRKSRIDKQFPDHEVLVGLISVDLKGRRRNTNDLCLECVNKLENGLALF